MLFTTYTLISTYWLYMFEKKDLAEQRVVLRPSDSLPKGVMINNLEVFRKDSVGLDAIIDQREVFA